MRTFYHLAIRASRLQDIAYVNAPDDQNTIVFLYLSADFSNKVSRLQINLARCQRAGKSAGQSATRSGYDVV